MTGLWNPNIWRLSGEGGGSCQKGGEGEMEGGGITEPKETGVH